jgi:GntR family transcriptional regulator
MTACHRNAIYQNSSVFSRLTVSRALKELVLDGRLYTKVGKGTFVSEEPINQTLDVLTSFSEEMEKRGQKPSSRVLDACIVVADDSLSQRLQVPVGVDLVCLKRVRLANRQPVALETAHIIANLCEGILSRFDFSRQSLYAVLKNHYNVHLIYAEQELEARMSTPEETRILQLVQPSPTLSIKRVTFTDGERPVEFVESAYRGDRYKFRARLKHI